jgi:acyl carrier protein
MSVTSPSSIAEQTIRTFLDRANKDSDITRETALFADGLGLDSLETAELSSMLEDDLGRDPFSEGLLPETVGEILDFYSDDFQLQP